jgi:hypothetical protein
MKYLWPSTAFNGDGSIILYVDDVRTSQETQVWPSWPVAGIPLFAKTRHRIRRYRCKISGFHGGDHEECRLLVYKNPDLTSQETHHVTTTEPSRLILCKI